MSKLVLLVYALNAIVGCLHYKIHLSLLLYVESNVFLHQTNMLLEYSLQMLSFKLNQSINYYSDHHGY